MSICQHPGCNKRASYGIEKITHCVAHKPERAVYQVRQCQHPGCTKQPGYGIYGKRTHCVAHKPEGAISMNKRQQCKYEGCTKRPGYGIEKRTHCAKHKPSGAVLIGKSRQCAHPGCTTGPGYGIGKRTHCFAHKPEGAVSMNKRLQCAHPGCTTGPGYGIGKRTHCFAHKPEGAVEIYKGQQCKHEGCTIKANYGIDGKRTHCAAHKPEGAIYIGTQKMCLSCGLVRSIKKYDYYCTSCFIWNFPDDPRVNLVRTKSKELRVRDYLNEHFEGFIHDRSINFGGCDCLHRRRVDFRKMIEGTMLAIEVDENGHRSYDARDEENRYNDLFMAHSGKWIFIRFNPDSYKDVAGKRRNN